MHVGSCFLLSNKEVGAKALFNLCVSSFGEKALSYFSKFVGSFDRFVVRFITLESLKRMMLGMIQDNQYR